MVAHATATLPGGVVFFMGKEDFYRAGPGLPGTAIGCNFIWTETKNAHLYLAEEWASCALRL